ncbi:hypothetical protein MOMA_02155 [Moraxella macacae 0408225]|uniref:Uncharacterized protein n=2 Tax=Moraxella macacae TaxID=765840 RepID=L2F812_9GAMM|nr:hypothetical protein MOMA_02155 [Moraxella macacae 0408225]
MVEKIISPIPALRNTPTAMARKFNKLLTDMYQSGQPASINERLLAAVIIKAEKVVIMVTITLKKGNDKLAKAIRPKPMTIKF